MYISAVMIATSVWASDYEGFRYQAVEWLLAGDNLPLDVEDRILSLSDPGDRMRAVILLRRLGLVSDKDYSFLDVILPPEGGEPQ